jgi:hypothetical protein
MSQRAYRYGEARHAAQDRCRIRAREPAHARWYQRAGTSDRTRAQRRRNQSMCASRQVW